jgi:hypothetical protein
MNKYIKLMSLGLVLATGLTSCETDDDDIRDAPREIGGYATLADRSITRFDRNEDLSITFFTADGVSAESVEILRGGEVLGTANVSGETATFNSSILGDYNFPDDDGVAHETGSFKIRIKTTYSNGKVSEDPFTISVGKVVHLGENPSETTMDSLSTRELEYEFSTFSADIDQVNLLLKKNDAGTYVDSGVDLSTEDGTVTLSETNYETLNLSVNDTLYYTFRAASGSLVDEEEAFIAIVPKAFQNSQSVTLSNNTTKNELNLATGTILAEGSADGEIRFMEPNGFEVINDADLDFVQVDSDFMDDADVLSAKAAYEMGNPMTSATDLESGDTFVYRVSREMEDEDGNMETMTFYGVFTIKNVVVVNGTAVSFDIDYAEGL